MKDTLFNPFLYFSQQLQRQLEACQTNNPAMELYTAGARGPLFMLEALMRLHAKAYNDEKLLKWEIRFKKLEDLMGQIDFYDVFAREFARNRKMPKVVIDYLIERRDKYAKKLNKELDKKNWATKRLQKFDAFVFDLPFNFDTPHIHELELAIQEELRHALDFIETHNKPFQDLESEVHEVRRKLRWMSIYAAALQGIIQLKPEAKKPAWMKNELSATALKSDYNKVLPPPKGKQLIHFNRDTFFALNWLVAQLGTIKDDGLRLELLAKSLVKEGLVAEEDSIEKADTILGKKAVSMSHLLKRASELVYNHTEKHHILEQLLPMQVAKKKAAKKKAAKKKAAKKKVAKKVILQKK